MQKQGMEIPDQYQDSLDETKWQAPASRVRRRGGRGGGGGSCQGVDISDPPGPIPETLGETGSMAFQEPRE
jgi:hypothetical protein